MYSVPGRFSIEKCAKKCKMRQFYRANGIWPLAAKLICVDPGTPKPISICFSAFDCPFSMHRNQSRSFVPSRYLKAHKLKSVQEEVQK